MKKPEFYAKDVSKEVGRGLARQLEKTDPISEALGSEIISTHDRKELDKYLLQKIETLSQSYPTDSDLVHGLKKLAALSQEQTNIIEKSLSHSILRNEKPPEEEGEEWKKDLPVSEQPKKPVEMIIVSFDPKSPEDDQELESLYKKKGSIEEQMRTLELSLKKDYAPEMNHLEKLILEYYEKNVQNRTN